MRLGLSMRIVAAGSYVEPRDALAQDWPAWLESLGHQPVFIPNGLRDPAGYIRSLDIKGLVLTGGNDVVERGDAPNDVAPLRTWTEHALIEGAVESGLPIFGVCRGSHMINLHFGGKVIADIKARNTGTLKHVASSHNVTLHSFFADIAQSPVIDVNSFHNQGLVSADLAPVVSVFAQSDDGLVEGFVHRTLPILAIQWHPERPNPSSQFDIAILDRLLREGAFWRGKLS